MKALFLVPPAEYNHLGQTVDRVYGCNWGFDYKPPIHLLQVATHAKDRLNWQVRLLDGPAEGTNAQALMNEVVDQQFDVLVFWTTYLSASGDLAAAQAIRQRLPQIRCVFMGAGATWKPDELLIDGRCAVILGEPEPGLEGLAQAWKNQTSLNGIRGIAWKDDSGVVQRGTPAPLVDVSRLPMPDRSLLRGRYQANRLEVGPITTMVVSRGCGFKCTFCCTNALDQAIELEFKRPREVYDERPPLRKRTVEQIIAEFEDIAAKGYRGVEIADNIFTWGKKRTIEICQGIEHLNLHWICLARANMLHDVEVIQAMSKAGCKLIYMGSESFDDGLLSDVAKELKVKDVLKAVETCREGGVDPEVSVLIGASPNETWKTLWNSWRAAKRLGTRFVHFSVALPQPSTQMYDEAMDKGWFIEGDFRPADNQREVLINLPNLSKRELQLALRNWPMHPNI